MASQAYQDDHRLPDDQVSMSSYHSDATLPVPGSFRDDDARSICSLDSHDSYDSSFSDDDRPCYRVSKEQGVSQPVYEAWTLYYSENQYDIEKTSFCGLNISRRYETCAPYVGCRTLSHDQEELSDMTLNAVHRYQAAHKRCLPSRLIRGRAKPYEMDLDERIQNLPRPVQSELNQLLGDRESATCNRFHRRDWTVVMMREEYRYNFTNSQHEEVTKSKRFWKKGAKRPIQYFFILRGAEGKVATDDKGMHTTTRHGNPWKRVDEKEVSEKRRARDMRRFGKGYVQDGWYNRPRDRVMSPPPPPPPGFGNLPPRRVRIERETPERFPTFNPFVPEPQFSRYSMPPPPPPPLGPSFSCGPMPPAPGFHYHQPPPLFPHSCCGNMLRYPPPPPPPPPMPMDSPRPAVSPFADFGMPVPSRMPMSPPPPSDFGESFGAHPPPLPRGQSVPMNFVDSFHLDMSQMPPPPHPEFHDLGRMFPNPAPFPMIPRDYTGSSRRSPPPAPRLSNLTTPTTFSRATSNHTGSSVDDTDISTPPEVPGQGPRVRGSGSVSPIGPWANMGSHTSLVDTWHVES